LDELFSRPHRAKALRSNFSHASARLLSMRDSGAVVGIVGDPGGPPHYELELIKSAHGWLVNAAVIGR
jgi:hypothetical protein